MDLATFEKNAKFNQNSSAGFIEIYGLGMKTAYQVNAAGEVEINKLESK